MKYSISMLLLAMSAPSLTMAQDISGGVTLGFGSHEDSEFSQDLASASLDGRLNLLFDNGIMFGVSAGYINVGSDDSEDDIQGDFVGLDLGYRFSNGMSLGAYVEELTLGTDASPIDISLRSVGLTGAYESEGLKLGAFLGETTTSPDLGADISNIGLTAKYAVQPKLNIGGAFLRATIDASGEAVDIDMVGIAATYGINDQVSIFGGVSRTTLGQADLDITTMGLGAGYDLTQMAGVASSVSLEVARTEQSSGDESSAFDTVRIGLTFPLGGKSTEAPLNSVADSIFNPRRGALNAALTGAF